MVTRVGSSNLAWYKQGKHDSPIPFDAVVAETQVTRELSSQITLVGLHLNMLTIRRKILETWNIILVTKVPEAFKLLNFMLTSSAHEYNTWIHG